MKIVISGGLGYVGGRLCEYLSRRGHHVIALSRQTSTLKLIKFPATMQVLHPDVLLGNADLIDRADVFVHLAALNENDCVKYPEKAIDVNIWGTVRWLEFAKAAGIPKFVYFSTAHVYAKPLVGHFNEASLARPLHPYAITHKCAEDYVLAYGLEKGMDNLVLRLTNSFGSPAFPTADRWTLLVNDFCKSAVERKEMILISDGLQYRDFICMSDVCRAVDHLLLAPTRIGNSVYNLASGKSVSVWEMAQKVHRVSENFLNTSIRLQRSAPVNAPNPSGLVISNEKLLGSGFALENMIDDEIVSTLNFFISQRIQSQILT